MAASRYYPMIVARTEDAAESVIREAAAMGYSYMGSDLAPIILAVRLETGREQGIGIYLIAGGRLSWLGYPHCLTNGAVTRVNSIAHALSYLNRAPKR